MDLVTLLDLRRLRYSGIPISLTLNFTNILITQTKIHLDLFHYNFTRDISNSRTNFPLPWRFEKLGFHCRITKYSKHLIFVHSFSRTQNKIWCRAHIICSVQCNFWSWSDCLFFCHLIMNSFQACRKDLELGGGGALEYQRCDRRIAEGASF